MQGLARITAWLFVVSSLFPVGASLLPSDPPRWLGIADVAVAAVLAIAAITLSVRSGVATDRECAAGLSLVRTVANGIPCLLVVFFLAGDRVHWTVLTIGLAWRAYLLIMVSPQLTRSAE